jgi:hypothetical protein
VVRDSSEDPSRRFAGSGVDWVGSGRTGMLLADTTNLSLQVDDSRDVFTRGGPCFLCVRQPRIAVDFDDDLKKSRSRLPPPPTKPGTGSTYREDASLLAAGFAHPSRSPSSGSRSMASR